MSQRLMLAEGRGGTFQIHSTFCVHGLRVEADRLSEGALDETGRLPCPGRGTGFAQAQQVVEDDQFEAALTSRQGHVRRRPKRHDRVSHPSFLGVNPGQGSPLVDGEAQAFVAAQRE